MATNKDVSADANFDSQNIFDELSEWQEIWDEVQQIEKKQEKDMFFYLKKTNAFFFFLNVVVFLGISLSLVYIYIQTQEEKKEYSFLSPICSLFLWDIEVPGNTCYGVQAVFSEYETKLSDEKRNQTEKILPALWEVYSVENFNLSKKVSFLLEKTNSRLRPKEILSAFDELKWIFAPVDKKEIRCYDISITSWNILNITCDAYSSDWDTSIVELKSEDSIESVLWWGTSISRASSFIYFLENHSKSKFQVLEKPDSFSKEDVQDLPYTQKTTMNLKLLYKNASNLSF